jgi:hypothetical protein
VRDLQKPQTVKNGNVEPPVEQVPQTLILRGFFLGYGPRCRGFESSHAREEKEPLIPYKTGAGGFSYVLI